MKEFSQPGYREIVKLVKVDGKNHFKTRYYPTIYWAKHKARVGISLKSRGSVSFEAPEQAKTYAVNFIARKNGENNEKKN